MSAEESFREEAASRAERTAQSQQTIANDRAQRIARHKLAVQAIRPLAAGASRPLNLFADGDSWFEYPLPGYSPKDVIVSLRDAGKPRPLILNLAHHGDLASDMLGVSQRTRMEKNLADPENGTFDAILFSGGGNDVVGDQFCLWLRDHAPDASPAEAINATRLAAVLGVVRSAYEDLIAVRDKVAPRCALFVHAYDFAIPTGIGVCGIGPWLKPSLDYRGWKAHPAAARIVKEVLVQFRDRLQSLASAHRDVIVVPTQGTLAADDWSNELHPTPKGFDKIAAVFRNSLQQRFPGRI